MRINYQYEEQTDRSFHRELKHDIIRFFVFLSISFVCTGLITVLVLFLANM